MQEPPRTLIHPGESAAAASNYSPAVRVGSHVYVSGIIAMRNGALVGVGDVAVQTREVLSNIEEALRLAGATMDDIVRYRIYLTDMGDLQTVRETLSPIFGAIRPAGTLVAVNALIHPDLRIEIDVDAVIGSGLAREGNETR